MSKAFYDLLFDADDFRCFTNTPNGTSVYPPSFENTEANFFCINPLMPHHDNQPVQNWHSRNTGRRADCNITKFRNILCEFDEGTLGEQWAIIEDMPCSTVVFSGNKSLHAIISLEEPCKDIKEYKALVKRIYDKLPTVDTSASNPSRLSRAPGVLRRDTHIKQDVEYIGKRISRAELDAWLGPAPAAAFERSVQSESWLRILNPWTKTYLVFGAEPGTRNATLFRAACDMFRAGYASEDIYARVIEVADLPEHEVWTCIASAEAATRTQYGDNTAAD